MDIEHFKELADVFLKHGYNLYLVGGSVRDYLLTSSFYDADLVTNASLAEMKKFLKVKSEFPLFESGKFIYKDNEFDITSMRKEVDYFDFRHPNKIERVSTPYEEYLRRDFTINALYMDKDGNILDYVDGIKDLNNKIIRCIGDPEIRLKEDPLRIIRAIRFKTVLNFEIEEGLLNAIKNNLELLKKLNYYKIREELSKFSLKNDDVINILSNYGINKVIPLNYSYELYKAISLSSYEKDMNFLDILNEIQRRGTFINIINIDSKFIKFLRKEISKYESLIEELSFDMDLEKAYSKRKYIICFKCDNYLDENNIILNSGNIKNIKFFDEDYKNIKNKKERNKIYYESFKNLLKVLSSR